MLGIYYAPGPGPRRFRSLSHLNLATAPRAEAIVSPILSFDK